jgi:hypothetical protein
VTARAAGVAYLATFVFSIPVLGLYEPVLGHPDYVLGAGADNQVRFGALLEFLLALSCVATGVALYPVAKRVSPTLGLGFVASRILEAGMILVGAISVLSIVTLRQGAGGPAALEPARALLAVHDWTFLWGQGAMPVVNALCLGTVLYRARLVPRWIPLTGLLGAPVLFGSKLVVLFGGIDDVGAVALVCALPIAVWEFSLGCRLVTKGFRAGPPEAVLQRPSITAPMLPADRSSRVGR